MDHLETNEELGHVLDEFERENMETSRYLDELNEKLEKTDEEFVKNMLDYDKALLDASEGIAEIEIDENLED